MTNREGPHNYSCSNPECDKCAKTEISEEIEGRKYIMDMDLEDHNDPRHPFRLDIGGEG